MDYHANRARHRPPLPEPVQRFIDAIKANARQAWPHRTGEANRTNMASPQNGPHDDDDFIASLLSISERDGDGSEAVIEISDNYERFFDQIYRYDVTSNTWRVRWSGAHGVDRPEQAYTFEQAMSDAGIMYTG